MSGVQDPTLLRNTEWLFRPTPILEDERVRDFATTGIMIVDHYRGMRLVVDIARGAEGDPSALLDAFFYLNSIIPPSLKGPVIETYPGGQRILNLSYLIPLTVYISALQTMKTIGVLDKKNEPSLAGLYKAGKLLYDLLENTLTGVEKAKMLSRSKGGAEFLFQGIEHYYGSESAIESAIGTEQEVIREWFQKEEPRQPGPLRDSPNPILKDVNQIFKYDDKDQNSTRIEPPGSDMDQEFEG
jgi:hypothetical protein